MLTKREHNMNNTGLVNAFDKSRRPSRVECDSVGYDLAKELFSDTSIEELRRGLDKAIIESGMGGGR